MMQLFITLRKRLDSDFFNMLTKMLAECDGSAPRAETTDEEGESYGGTQKIDATCYDAEVRYPHESFAN